MNSPEAEELEYTRPVEAAPPDEQVEEKPAPSTPPPSTAEPSSSPPPPPPPTFAQAAEYPSSGYAAPAEHYAPAVYAAPVDHPQPAPERQENVLYVPLAITVGDGFKLGCGFFMAFVVALLVGFVVLAALFALTSVMGINLPVGR